MSAASTASSAAESPWRIERDAFARAFGGACLFGIPLLFTMEMWWIGETLPRPQLLGFLVMAMLVNVALAYFAGFRRGDCTVPKAIAEAFEATAVGIVAALLVLLALHRIRAGDSLDGVLGMIVLQAVPLSIGASVASTVFDTGKGRVADTSSDTGPVRELLSDVGATAAGAMFLGFAIAPTEEVPMLAVSLDLASTLGLAALTMIAMYLIVFASGFDPDHRARVDGGLFQHPFSETVLAYTVSLGAATVLLGFFGQISFADPLNSILQEIIVLAVPASIGGAAGRIIT